MLSPPPRAGGSPRLSLARAALQRWRSDPVQLARDLFGLEPWSRQEELLRLAAETNRLAVRSGHKCGKSISCALLAWWWVLTRPEARVVLLAPTYRQIEEIVWREILTLYRRARFPFGGRASTKPEKGIRFRDGGQIFGFSTDSKERVAGYSGNILYILDEASGIPDEIHEVVSTSPLGKVVMISNPTRNEGAFYRAFRASRSIWSCLHISSEEAARENPIFTLPDGERRQRIPGLADDDWLAARREEFGADSYYYDVRARGEFSKQSDNAMIPLGLVEAARARWSEAPLAGPLEIGVDVARFGTDDTSIVWRRGLWAAPPIVLHGNDNVSVAGKVLELVGHVRRGTEVPLVRVDTSSGGGVADILRRHEGLLVVDVMAQESALDAQYQRRRDELWASLRKWLAAGGAICEEPRLHADMAAPLYDYDEKGRIKVESKKELRKRLGRSTDRADALALAVFDDGTNPEVFSLVFGDKFAMPKARF